METINQEEMVYCSTCDKQYPRKDMVSWYSTDSHEEHVCPHCANMEADYVEVSDE